MVTLISFGHKYGVPQANFKFDVSFFKNPWRDEKIKNEKDPIKRKLHIMKFMREQKGVEKFVDQMVLMIRHLNNTFPDENLIFAFCCSAGEYRSPAIVEMVAEELDKFKIDYHKERNKNSKI